MKIGILQTGRIPEELKGTHLDYDQKFVNLFKNKGYEFIHYSVLDKAVPQNPLEADGWLITGSKFGVYEPHAWIPPLEEFIKKTFRANIPLVGICFGHQLIAQALGGKVEKFNKGWSVGSVDYKMIESNQIITQNAWHQDQITLLPDRASIIARSDFCEYAALRYDQKALTYQFHPEFSSEFMTNLIAVRSSILPEDIQKIAIDSLKKPLSTNFITNQIDLFFNRVYYENS